MAFGRGFDSPQLHILRISGRPRTSWEIRKLQVINDLEVFVVRARSDTGALKPVLVQHMAAITDPKRVGDLLRAIGSYKSMPITQAALQLAPLVFVRPVELRKAESVEFDLDAFRSTIAPQ